MVNSQILITINLLINRFITVLTNSTNHSVLTNLRRQHIQDFPVLHNELMQLQNSTYLLKPFPSGISADLYEILGSLVVVVEVVLVVVALNLSLD